MDFSNMDYFLTGYNDLRHSQVNAPTLGEVSMDTLMDLYLNKTTYTYQEHAEKLDGPSGILNEAPFGLQGSTLLSQLPWLTPWPLILEASELVKIF